MWTADQCRDYAKHFHAQFPTQKAKTERAQQAVNSNVNGPLTEGRDLNAALALLGTHPEVDDKVGAGVESIEIRPAMYGTRGFYIQRIDGTGTDFSWKKCVKAPTARDNVRAACREAIRPQIVKYKHDCLVDSAAACELLGVAIDASNSQVHHAPPMFDTLVDTWVEQHGGYNTVSTACLSGDNVYGNRLRDDHYDDWTAFHGREAKLMLVHSAANASLEAARRKAKKAS
jgi:hypothetical protein